MNHYYEYVDDPDGVDLYDYFGVDNDEDLDDAIESWAND